MKGWKITTLNVVDKQISEENWGTDICHSFLLQLVNKCLQKIQRFNYSLPEDGARNIFAISPQVRSVMFQTSLALGKRNLVIHREKSSKLMTGQCGWESS